jgi:MFS family permease
MTSAVASPASRIETDRKLRRVVLASSGGTIFEAYDFILFGSLAPLISRQFFAGINETAAFVLTLLTFAAGFAVRPLGALIFGRMGDRSGRKQAFLITITLMGLSTFCIGLLPTYATAGIWAPILLIALRLIQGLAYGGNYGGAVVYTAEHAPPGRRGLYVGWIQTAAGFALFASFLAIFVTRTVSGEDSFSAWGWRIPFLISIGLLFLSLWIRLALDESPLFQKMVAEGRTSKRPLSEAFLEWRNLRMVLVALFGLMSVQGVLWYTAHFYTQFFLSQILKVAPATVTLIMLIATAVGVFQYVFFSWLSDKIGRKRVMLTGMVLAIITAFPQFHALTAAANPALAAAQKAAPIILVSDPLQCSLQFDPVGEAAFVSSCDIAKSTLAKLGISYRNDDAAPGSLAYIKIGDEKIDSAEGRGLAAPALAAVRRGFEGSLGGALRAAGYPNRADPDKINLPLVIGIVLLGVTFAVMVYAPVPAMVVEFFPTRIRYSALSLPYHIGSGWFGGFLPAIAFAMVAATGDIYYGLWYPVIVTAIGAVVLAIFTSGTQGQNLDEV